MYGPSSLRLRPRPLRSLSYLLCAVLLFPTTATQAQSGRRIPKQPSSTDPKPPSQTEPPIQSSTTPVAAARLPLLVVKNLPTVGSSSIYTKIALDGCVDELKRSTAVQISSGGDKNRKEASDYAKASKDTYVLLIQLDSDVAGFERPNVSIAGGDPRSLCVSYTLFIPGTGKVKTHGRVYQGQRRGPIGVQLPPSSPALVDYELRRCGQEVADRVLDALNLAPPQRH